jgi:hypothetical protein
VREKDVVNVHPHAGLKNGQHVETLVTDIAAELHRVARIYEQNVVRFELRKEIDIDLFDALLDQFDVGSVAV